MPKDLNRESLRMNTNKTRVMVNCNIVKKIIKIENDELEEVQEYISLGQVLTLKKP